MPLYWDTKALRTPTLTLHFIFNFLIISLIFIENKCLCRCDMKFKKGTHFTIYATGADV